MSKEKTPIISICIPTWNRWYALQHTLKSIIDQDEFKSGDVEIVISDNASTDETEKEVKKLCKEYENIRYFRNKKNIGGNANINKILSLGIGKYLRLLGSDDYILNNGLKETLHIIENESPDIIYHNTIRTSTFHFLKNKYFIKNKGIHIFNSQKAFFSFIGDQYSYDKKSFLYNECLMSFMSIMCLSKEYYEESIKNIYNEFNQSRLDKFYFSQSIILHYNEIKRNIVLLNKPFVGCYKGENSTGYYVDFQMANDMVFLFNFLIKKFNINSLKFKIFKYRECFQRYLRILLSYPTIRSKKLGIYKTISPLRRKYILKNGD